MKSNFFSYSICLFLSTNIYASAFTDCYNVAKSAFTYRSESVKACGRATAGFRDCYRIAKGYYTYRSTAIEICGKALPTFKECFEVAKPFFTYNNGAIEACVGHED